MAESLDDEYVAPKRITLDVLETVRVKLALREPISPNTVYRCIGWAEERIGKLEDTMRLVRQRVEDRLEDTFEGVGSDD